MFYRLLGMAVWKGGKFYVGRKYGGKLPPRALAGIGGLLVLALGALLFSARRGDTA
jgi:putative Ca2+/H+ antiporter (TMEM165/GDT1 family)